MPSHNKTFLEPDDVETQVFDWGRLSWLSEPRTTGTQRFSAGVVVLAPGKGHVRHNHPGVEEILYVISGRGLQMVEINGVPIEREVTPGMLVHIPPDVFHSTVNTGIGPMNLLAVYSPPGPEALLRAMEGIVIEPAAR
ncbi:MAG: cupin domain-containing protein [Candidatus Hydrogenedentes bacterium]|nr:cupin domain-containing protein [Candidatus Hydrogenedentota bacterium]